MASVSTRIKQIHFRKAWRSVHIAIHTDTVPFYSSAPSTSQPPTSGGPFGSSSQQEKAPTNLFGTSLSISQPQQSSNLFGSTNVQSSQSSGLFGSTTAGQPQQGTNPLATSTSGQAGGLYGAQTTNKQQPTGGGLFGAQQQPQQPSTSLFSNMNAQSQPSTSLFGNASTQPTSQQGGGIFGSLGPSQAQSKPQTLSVFNDINQRSVQDMSNVSLFGRSLNSNSLTSSCPLKFE